MLPVGGTLQELLHVLGAAGVLAVDGDEGRAGVWWRLVTGNLHKALTAKAILHHIANNTVSKNKYTLL